MRVRPTPIATEEVRRYGVHGLVIDVQGNESVARALVARVMDQLGLRPGAGPAGASVSLRISPWTRAAQVPASARMLAEHDGIRAWSSDGLLYLDSPGHLLRLDVPAAAAEYWLREHATLRKDIIVHALFLLLRRRGYYGLHASGVARGESGCLFVAGCGSSKSTQTFALARQGWGYLADDALLLRGGRDAVEALALRRDLYLDPALSHAFPEVAAHGGSAPASRGKRRMAMSEMFPAQLVDRCVPRLLVFPEIAARGRSRFVRLRPADALARLMDQSACLTLDRDAFSGHVELLSRLVGQARSYRLLAGRDLRDDPEAIARYLSAIILEEVARGN
jgi:hypothetical protein